MKDYFKLLEEDFFNEERIKEARADNAKGKYIDIVNSVIDKKRDEELSRILFDKKGINLKKVIETVDHYEEIKKKFEEDFRKNVSVKFE